MAIPAYLWLKDDGGANITGSVDVQHREGSIEVLSFGHGLHIPTDGNTGKLTGTRIHSPLTIEKEFDSSSPYLYRAVATGQTLKSAEIKCSRCRKLSGILWSTLRQKQSDYGKQARNRSDTARTVLHCEPTEWG